MGHLAMFLRWLALTPQKYLFTDKTGNDKTHMSVISFIFHDKEGKDEVYVPKHSIKLKNNAKW